MGFEISGVQLLISGKIWVCRLAAVKHFLQFHTATLSVILILPFSLHIDCGTFVTLLYSQRVHEYVHRVLGGQCRPGSTRQSLLAQLPASSRKTQPFLWKDEPLPDDLFLYPPPFGFRGLQGKVEDLLKLVSAASFTLPGLPYVFNGFLRNPD